MTAALEWSEWSAARPGCTLPQERPGTHFTGGWVGPRVWSGQAENLVPTSIRSCTVQPVISHYTNWAIWSTYGNNYTPLKYSRVSFFVTVRFATFHFYNPCRDRALPTCGTSLSQLKRPFSTQCASSSFPVCVCFFFFFYFSAVLFSRLWFFHPWHPSNRQKRRKIQNSWHYILSWCLLNHSLGLLQQNKKWFNWYSFNYLCNFLYT